jgi:6-hydroxymethylpterin diphosphokinase MptE-like
MINQGMSTVPDEEMKVFEGISFADGFVNVEEAIILDHVRSAIRRGHPQIRPQAPTYDRIALVGSGPSLAETEQELVQAVREGAKLVTLNGAYHWCLAHNLQPRTQIVLDARPSNARFVQPEVPGCRYVLASQCAPEVWDAVAGRPQVWIFHASTGLSGPLREILDTFYQGQWFGVTGGVTVLTRALNLLRALGYLRFDLFGCDSCWMHGEHHAMAQPENAHDKCVRLRVWWPGDPTKGRTFICSPWHLKQFEDFLQTIRINGNNYQIAVHGHGLLAYALEASVNVEWSQESTDGSTSLQDLQPCEKEDRQHDDQPRRDDLSDVVAHLRE